MTPDGRAQAEAELVALVEAAADAHPESPPPESGRAALEAWFSAVGLPMTLDTLNALRLVQARRALAENPGGVPYVHLSPRGQTRSDP